MRQDHVKEELIRTNSQSDKRSPILKTFAEAKQKLAEEYPETYDVQGHYNNEYNDLNSTFAEADETNYVEENYDSYDSVNDTRRFDYESQTQRIEAKNKTTHTIRSAESFLNDSSPEYFQPEDYIRAIKKDRNRRRRSRDLPVEPEIIISTSEEPKRKPETMRSISEDSGQRAEKIVPRRSLSHPEKDSQAKQTEATKIPSPKPLAELLDRQKKLFSKLPSPRRKTTVKPVEQDQVDEVELPINKPVYKFQKMLEKRGDSKSFDAVVKQVIKSDIGPDDKSQSMDDTLFSDNAGPKEVNLLLLKLVSNSIFILFLLRYIYVSFSA